MMRPTNRQIAVLMMTFLKGSICSSDVCNAFYSDRSVESRVDACGVLERLVKRGLLEVIPSEKVERGRRHHYRLTPAGRQLLRD